MLQLSSSQTICFICKESFVDGDQIMFRYTTFGDGYMWYESVHYDCIIHPTMIGRIS